MTTALGFFFAVGVPLSVHYLGHFMAARRLGVRVTPFSLGYGRGFLSKTKWQRFQVLIMGPLMNLVLAVVALAVVLAQDTEVPAYRDEPVVIGKVVPGSPAEQAGLKPGDQITRAADRPIETWADLDFRVGTEALVSFVREGKTRDTRVKRPAEGRYEFGGIGVIPKSTTVVRMVEKGEPADRAGVRPGDEVLTVNGEPVLDAADLRPAVQKSADHEIEMTIRRDGQEKRLRMRAEMTPTGPRIGLSPAPASKFVRLSPIAAMQASVAGNYASTLLIFRTLGGLVTRGPSASMRSPFAVAPLSGQAAQASWITLLALMSILSLNIGILNLLPVPLFDGWYVLIIGLEGLLRRDFSLQIKDKMLLAGFVVLTTLIVLYNIARIG